MNEPTKEQISKMGAALESCPTTATAILAMARHMLALGCDEENRILSDMAHEFWSHEKTTL